MVTIRQLPPTVVNKIAAGEVVERPASALKELIENAVDAGARRIDVAVEQGGARLIRVVDDGCGIAAEQLPLAVASHATSKIRSDEDLFGVKTLGFRGEALASIASVSRLTIRSRHRDAEAGAELEVIGGAAGQVEPSGCPVGSVIELRDLFFNTPVRQKFLRTTQTEMGHATEAFTRLALANLDIHFSLKHNDRLLYDLPPVRSWQDRIAAFFGQELAAELIDVASEDELVKVQGLVANPSHSRGNTRMQYLFLNGRFIRDRSLQHALGEAYRGLLLTGRFPICFLTISMPHELIDVNVHPTKLEVRFQDGGRLYSQLLGTIRTKFLNTDLTARLQPDTAVRPGAASEEIVERRRQEVVNWVAAVEPPRNALGDGPQPAPFRPFSETAVGPATVDPGIAPASQPPEAERTTAQSADTPQLAAAGAAAAMQVLDRYLIAEVENAVIVIDQHALHERILYEQLRDKVLGGAMERQNLLVPEPVDLAPAEAAAVLDAQDLLAQLGVQIEPFGGGTLLVSSYPAMLAKFSPVQLLRSLAEQLTSGSKPPDRRDILDDLLHRISCHAAVKAGDRLSSEEVTALMQQRDLAQDAHHCPHGRPTALVFTREELDKQFLRT